MTDHDFLAPAVAAVDRLRRWEFFGGHWRIRSRTSSLLEIVLLTCDGGEEVDRLKTSDPACLAYVGCRITDQDETL